MRNVEKEKLHGISGNLSSTSGEGVAYMRAKVLVCGEALIRRFVLGLTLLSIGWLRGVFVLVSRTATGGVALQSTGPPVIVKAEL